MKAPLFLIILAFTLFPILALLEIPLEKAIGPNIQVGVSFISFLLFLWGLIKAINQKGWIMLTGGVGIVLFVGYCWLNSVSETVFLGQPIGRAYYAEAPGFIELTVYENQDCIITFGGPIGRDTFYTTYSIQDEKLIVDTDKNLGELAYYSNITISGKQYQIETE